MLLSGERDGLAAIPLTDPDASHLIGLVVSDRDPLPPVAQALLNLAARLDLGAMIDSLTGMPPSAGFR